MAMKNGVLAGYPIDTMKVRLFDGSYHDVDSDSLSFEICAKIAFKGACKQAKPVLLEPIMKIEVVTPSEYLGDVLGDLNSRRSQVQNMDARGTTQVVTAFIPLAETFQYATHVRSITTGRASFAMELDHYSPVPRNVAEKVTGI